MAALGRLQGVAIVAIKLHGAIDVDILEEEKHYGTSQDDTAQVVDSVQHSEEERK